MIELYIRDFECNEMREERYLYIKGVEGYDKICTIDNFIQSGWLDKDSYTDSSEIYKYIRSFYLYQERSKKRLKIEKLDEEIIYQIFIKFKDLLDDLTIRNTKIEDIDLEVICEMTASRCPLIKRDAIFTINLKKPIRLNNGNRYNFIGLKDDYLLGEKQIFELDEDSELILYEDFEDIDYAGYIKFSEIEKSNKGFTKFMVNKIQSYFERGRANDIMYID